jgi:hypothetical protein
MKSVAKDANAGSSSGSRLAVTLSGCSAVAALTAHDASKQAGYVVSGACCFHLAACLLMEAPRILDYQRAAASLYLLNLLLFNEGRAPAAVHKNSFNFCCICRG